MLLVNIRSQQWESQVQEENFNLAFNFVLANTKFTKIKICLILDFSNIVMGYIIGIRKLKCAYT